MSAALAASAGRHHFQPGRLGLGLALRIQAQTYDHVQAGIAQVQRMRVPLAAVADNRDGLAFEEANIAVLFVITLCHLFKNSVGFSFSFQMLFFDGGRQLELLRFERYSHQAGTRHLDLAIAASSRR